MKKKLLTLSLIMGLVTLAFGRYFGDASFVHSRIISSAPITLLQVDGFNNRAADCYIQIHASGTVPSNGATPVISKLAFSQLNYSITFPEGSGINLDACTIVASTTKDTLTITTGATDTDKVSIQAITK